MFSEARNTMWSQKIKYWQDKGCWCEISAPFSCPKRHRKSYGVFYFPSSTRKLYWKGWEIEGISSCRKCKSSVHRFSHMEKQMGTELNFFRKRTLFQTAGGRWDYGGISHWENPRLHGDGKPSSAEHGTVAESEGATVPHAILAGGLGLHHQRPCPDMPGWSGQHLFCGSDVAKALGYSIVNQKKILEKYAREHGYSNFKFYVDDGISGTTFAGVR